MKRRLRRKDLKYKRKTGERVMLWKPRIEY